MGIAIYFRGYPEETSDRESDPTTSRRRSRYRSPITFQRCKILVTLRDPSLRARVLLLIASFGGVTAWSSSLRKIR